MVVIYGHRSYGRIDAHGGEHAHTSFAHVYYMPLFPLRSFWVTEDHGDTVRGFEIKMSGKSVLATYLRMWGPLFALIAFASGGLQGKLLGAGLAVACAYAWTWRSLRGELAQRQSDFHVLAFGTRCDPSRMPADLRFRFKSALDDKWAKLATGRPPDDVAKYGAKSLDEAVIAYGLLRLAALDKHEGAQAAADRILHGTHDTLPTADGPYRADHAPAETVIDGVGAAAAARIAQAPAPVLRAKRPWWAFTRRKAAILAFLGLASIGGIVEESPGLRASLRPDPVALDFAHPGNRFVEVECANPRQIGEFTNHKELYTCDVGKFHLAVIGTPTDNVITGRLKSIFGDTRFEWPSEINRSNDFYNVYLELESKCTSATLAIACIGVLALVLGIAGFWIKRARSAS